MSDDDRWRRCPEVLWRRTTTGVLLLGPDHAAPIGLSGPAEDLWDLFEESRSLDQVVTALSEAYAVARCEVLAGLESVVTQLVDSGALEPA